MDKEPIEEIHRHRLCFRDWQILGKRYLEELTMEEMEIYRKLHQEEREEPIDSEE